MWKNDGKYMQNWAGCSSLTRYDQGGNIITLTDIRDSNNYNIAKLKDGKCWMLDNLTTRGITINSNDSDLPGGSFSIPNSSRSDFNSTYDHAVAYYHGSPTYTVYYTWYAATAGTGTVSISSGEAPGSICPKNWHLPHESEYNTLMDYYNTTSSLKAQPVPNYPYSGAFSPSGYEDDLGSNLDQWSSTADGSYSAYFLHDYNNGTPSKNYSNSKTFGLTVRCVAN